MVRRKIHTNTMGNLLGEGSFDAPTFERFESVHSFLDALEERGIRCREDRSWSGESVAECKARARDGYLDAVPEAEKILARIEASINTHGLMRQWGHSVVGAFPDVGAFLTGEPECMRRMSDDYARSSMSEINFWYSPVCSAGIRWEDSFRRGVVVLAAIMALSRVRPVNVFYFTCCGIHDQIIRVRSNPLVLSEAAYVLTSCTFYRSLSYGMSNADGWQGGWGKWACMGRNMTIEQKIAHMRKCLHLEPDDVLIPGAHMEETSDAIRNPVAWINGLLDKYRG